jgi:hypothetical protein
VRAAVAVQFFLGEEKEVLLPMNEGDIEIKSDFYLLKIKEKRT